MPYPNDNRLNVVLMQTSASTDGSGKFPFTERIISGSNLFILTDANGNLTGSTSIPGGSFTNLTVTGALTASIISASNAITAAAATFDGPVTMSSTLSASGGIITSTISASSNVYVSGSLTVVGNIVGTIDSASVVSIAPINNGSTYYVTFVDSISGSRQLKTDADILSYTPLQNVLTVGTSVSGSLTIGSKLSLVDSTASASLRVGINTTDTASLLVSSNAFQVIKGQGPGVDKVFTNLELSASNNVLFSNTTQATDWNNGALNVVGGVGIGKNLYVSGSLNAIGEISASTLRVETSIVDGGFLTVLGNTVLGDAITDTTIITGSTSISGSLTVIGNIAGTIDSASAILITDTPTTVGTYYVTFVDGTSGVRAVRTDSSTLTWNPSTNTLSSSGNLYVGGGTVDGPNGTVNLFAAATSINIGSSPNDPVTTFFGDIKLDTGLIKGTTGAAGLQIESYGIQVYGNSISSSAGTPNIILNTSQDITSSRNLRIAGTTQATDWNNGALTVAGGVGIGKNLYVSGSTFLYGDLTIYGTGSVVNISSSTVIIGDNRIQLNAGVPIQRYAGIDVFDSGSGTFTNNVTSSLLWDGLNDYWVLVSANSSSGAPLTQSSAIMIGGPTGSFGGESLLTINYIPKVQSSGRNLQNSGLSDTGTVLTYAGTGISASQVTSSQLIVQYTGSITYATGVYITYTTGSFTTITITTGSNPGLGDQVPSSPNANGLAGQINVDNNFIYVYTNQVWKRVPLSTWTA